MFCLLPGLLVCELTELCEDPEPVDFPAELEFDCLLEEEDFKLFRFCWSEVACSRVSSCNGATLLLDPTQELPIFLVMW